MISWDDGWLSMQEPPQFVLFSRAENGGAAQVRNILNRAVGAHEDAVRQVSMLCQQGVCPHSCALLVCVWSPCSCCWCMLSTQICTDISAYMNVPTIQRS